MKVAHSAPSTPRSERERERELAEIPTLRERERELAKIPTLRERESPG